MNSGDGHILSLETNLTGSCERNWANTTGGPANPEPRGRDLGWEEECPVALRFRASWIISSLSPSGSHGKSGPSVVHCRPLSPHFQGKFWGPQFWLPLSLPGARAAGEDGAPTPAHTPPLLLLCRNQGTNSCRGSCHPAARPTRGAELHSRSQEGRRWGPELGKGATIPAEASEAPPPARATTLLSGDRRG